MIGEIAKLDVSRETLDRLNTYEELLKKWNRAINLVSPSTIRDAKSRHFVDSAQIYGLADPNWKIWCDLGSGGGFPGMVIAILAAELNPAGKVVLVESDQRKAAFLRTVARETGVSAQVHSKRIEEVDPINADILSARALASLDQLLGFATIHMKAEGQALFPKGATWQQEVEEAQRSWSFSLQAHKSVVELNSVILSIGGIARG
ncbi:16S rRNA (guanine(527)-N(7))-methyltransferase RsmG [Donghicola sp. C2-DW-16]|uniref:Ribosomal RNA small subunit methyltransferase G n=1 Tax=Donghicola mangrovi TaxID=2729614 RepID=A0ABX2PB22_9RHOB|nr:16S rRNA (guanine(527)-N(7))-methyltransferase RsmG [Donghicola mangrovi]NVO26027.1 16S rRNA (guanine(527)-N(7))-methyltransferase RsmG [Donghicola mangrovi]